MLRRTDERWNGTGCRRIRALLLGTFLLVWPAAGQAQTAASCNRSGWSDPVALLPDSGVLSSPLLAFRDGQLFVVGNSMRGLWWNTIGLRIVRPGAESIPTPEGSFYFAGPLIAYDARWKLNLFRAEPAPGTVVPDSALKAPVLTRVDHSIYLGPNSRVVIQGKPVIWTVPEEIYQASEVHWFGGRGSRALVADDGTLHLAFASGRGSQIAHLRQKVGETRQVTEFLNAPAGYPELAFGRHGELYMAFVGPAPLSHGGDANSVLFRRSTDGGLTWEEPVLVSRSGLAEAHGAKMVVMPGGEIHLSVVAQEQERRPPAGGHLAQLLHGRGANVERSRGAGRGRCRART